MIRRLLLLCVLVLAACGDGETAQPAAAPPPIRVEAVTAQEAAVSDPILATGEVRADKITEVKPRVDGVIEAVFVDVGDRVAKGDRLFRTRQADYVNRVEERRQALSVAQAEQRQASGDLERATALRARGVVSQGRMDEIQAQFDTARARTGMAEAALAQARQDLSDATVTAPYDGMVTGRFVDEGTMIQVATSNTPVVEVAKLDEVEVVAHVAAVHLPRIQPETPVTVEFEGLDRRIEARLGVINDKVDARTRSVEIRLRLPNPDLAIKPGLFARLTLHPAPRRAVALARAAILGADDAPYVFVPDGQVARRRSVKIRDLDAARVEVVAGMKPGETALAGPAVSRLRDGAPFSLMVADGSR